MNENRSTANARMFPSWKWLLAGVLPAVALTGAFEWLLIVMMLTGLTVAAIVGFRRITGARLWSTWILRFFGTFVAISGAAMLLVSIVAWLEFTGICVNPGDPPHACSFVEALFGMWGVAVWVYPVVLAPFVIGGFVTGAIVRATIEILRRSKKVNHVV